MFDDNDPHSPANMRAKMRNDRKNTHVLDRPAPTPHPRDVRRVFQEAGIRGPDYLSRRRDD